MCVIINFATCVHLLTFCLIKFTLCTYLPVVVFVLVLCVYIITCVGCYPEPLVL